MIAVQLLLDPLGILAIPVGFSIGQVAKVGLLGLALAIRLRGFTGSPDRRLPEPGG